MSKEDVEIVRRAYERWNQAISDGQISSPAGGTLVGLGGFKGLDGSKRRFSSKAAMSGSPVAPDD